MKPEKKRLDVVLVERGFFESREKAQAAIMAGEVIAGDHRADKAGMRVDPETEIRVKGGLKYVGRGGLKLEAALDHFQIDARDKVCLDIGASTGGFTDCLLQRGARRVHAIDVGHSQLDWRIRNDPRVIAREKVNARYLTPADFPEAMDLCVMDVSFISLTLILPPAREVLTPTGVMLALIKPQFELSKEEVGKGGIVRDAAAHERAVSKVRDFATMELGCAWAGVMESPILGGEGNKEFLACLRR